VRCYITNFGVARPVVDFDQGPTSPSGGFGPLSLTTANNRVYRDRTPPWLPVHGGLSARKKKPNNIEYAVANFAMGLSIPGEAKKLKNPLTTDMKVLVEARPDPLD